MMSSSWAVARRGSPARRGPRGGGGGGGGGGPPGGGPTGGPPGAGAGDFFVRRPPAEIVQLEHWGCPWSREPDGRVAVRAFGGMSVKRTAFAADRVGFHLLHTLFQASLKYENIERLDEWFVTQILTEGGKVVGVVALDLRSGTIHAIAAKAVVITTGGAGRLYEFTTNGAIKTGDGMALAYRAGVPLKDMEFLQFHPTCLPGTG